MKMHMSLLSQVASLKVPCIEIDNAGSKIDNTVTHNNNGAEVRVLFNFQILWIS